MRGGIDLGGTKIEACLFDSNLEEITRRRIPTPRDSYERLLDSLVEQYEWMRREAGVEQLSLGVGIPGIVDADTGLSLTSNLPANRRPLRQDLSRRLGFHVPFQNDCKCFALSEANGGAGAGYETVFGLILGTGCGGGVCHRGQLTEGRNGLPGEVGHLGIPVEVIAGASPPLIRCKCGRNGCFETLISGPGISRMAKSLKGVDLEAHEIATGAASDAGLAEVMELWAAMVCELFRMLQATVDPDCIVLGGGVSRIPDVLALLVRHMPDHLIDGTRMPDVVLAKYGDSSGVRGAAMLASSVAPER
jgi:N-acetylglucosamine kinase